MNTSTKQTVKLENAVQTIDFSSPNSEDSIEVCSTDVVVIPSSGNHDGGSSKVKLHNVVDYTWEERFYTGKLLAVHMGGVYIAYGIKAATKTAGVVRIVNRQSNERALIKGMEGAVQDIAFSHIPQQIIVACVDLKGNLFIYKVIEETTTARLICELLLHVLPDDSYIIQPGDFFRVIWCPLIPESPDQISQEPEDVSWLLALSRGRKVELWNIKVIISNQNSVIGPIKPGGVDDGYIEICDHTKPIVDAAFSPDGTAIATASLDGDIKFFQVYMQNTNGPRCLHHWSPHEGKPVSSLVFLDNHKSYDPDTQFWKFAITGANNNSELKVWSCESWTCLQTLSFQVTPDRPLKLSSCLDLAAGYLLLSDFHRKVLYVLELYTDNSETVAAITSISEFLLPYPILSFGIVDAGKQFFKSANLQEVCDDNDEENVSGVLVKMYLVQPKSLQDCQVAFIPAEPGSFDKSLLLKPGSHIYDDKALTELPLTNGSLTSSNLNLHELPANHSALQMTLMTPDAFNSPVKHDTSGNSNLMKSHTEESSYSNTTTLVASPHSPDETDNVLLAGVVEAVGPFGFPPSGGSSPSREVQEILGETECYFQGAGNIHEDSEQIDLTTPDEKPATSVWPEIPMLRATEVRKNEEQARRSVSQGETSMGEGEILKMNLRLETSISSMIHIMNSLMQAFEEQSNEIKQLREEMQQQTLLRDIDKVVSRESQQQTLFFEKILATMENTQQQEVMTATISSNICNFVSTKIGECINKEITTKVAPAIMNQMDSLKHQVHNDLGQKLSATDHLLKENLTKLVHSKSVIDVLSAAVVSSLTPVISQCYKEYFTTIVLPSFEKSCSSMFNQINETFSKGSKEFVSNLDAQSRRISEKNHEQNVQLNALGEVLKSSTAQISIELKKSVANTEKHLLEAVNRAMTLQQATIEGSVIAAVRSGAVTPAPLQHVLDTQLQQTQIIQLIGQGQINAAFQQALSASDLSLVVFVCDKVNPQQLFSQVPCPLQQHVLLSLVQQLSADMNNNTEIKHKYLEEALMNLDTNNPVTREHLPTVLNNLQRQLQTYISNNPNNRITRSMKLLLLASQALI